VNHWDSTHWSRGCEAGVASPDDAPLRQVLRRNMGKKKKKPVPAARPEDPQMDSRVVAALRESWRTQYGSSDEDVVDQEVELMQQRGHCCYMALEEGVGAQHFHGVSNFLAMPQYVQVATDALQMLVTDHCYSAVVTSKKDLQHKCQPKSKGKDSKHMGETLQDPSVKEGRSMYEKPQTATGISSKPMYESGRPSPRPRLFQDVNEGKSTCRMWYMAVSKAQAEMAETFDYDALCSQGKRLFKMVLLDKTKRLCNKLKARHRWKQKQKDKAAPED